MQTVGRAHRVLQVLLTQVDKLLIELSESKDPERHMLFCTSNNADVDDITKIIAAYGETLKTNSLPSGCDEDKETNTSNTAINTYQLLIAKKKIMKDLVHMIEAVETALEEQDE